MNITSVIRHVVAGPEAIPELAELAIDDLRGLDFLRNVEPKELGLDPAIVIHYSPTSRTWLCSVLDKLNLSASDAIIDVGCGKGAAMRIMLEYPFGRIEGVELSPQLASIAKRNFDLLEVPPERVCVHAGDACEFDGYDHFNYVYLYNPFPMAVFEPFFARLAESLGRRPRELTLIYNNPVCRDQVEASGLFRKMMEITADWHNPMCVYVSV